ncbi:MAG: 1-acyl-sn-glycerol-3-phosphate acyltransferase [Streptosporangiaceae bacterium]
MVLWPDISSNLGILFAPAAITLVAALWKRPSPSQSWRTAHNRFRLRTPARLLGGANVPASGPAILASNHLPVIDSACLPLLLGRPVTFPAKAEAATPFTRAAVRSLAGLPGAVHQLLTAPLRHIADQG